MMPEDTVRLLAKRINDKRSLLNLCDLYYSGKQPIAFMAPEVQAQVGDRLAPLVINWPRVVVDSVLRRLHVDGFRLGKGGEADDELWALWQFSDMDGWSRLGMLDALVHGGSYLSVWTDPDDEEMPRITAESSHQMTVEYEPGDRQKLRSALKLYHDGEVQRATLYGPDEVRRFVRPSRQGLDLAGFLGADWRIDGPVLDNPLGVVPVVPLPNKNRLLNAEGESELVDIIPIADAVNKLATDMLLSSEFHAMPRRYATGIQIPPGEGGKERTAAEVAKWWDNATKGKTWLAGQGVEFGQFPEAGLEGFVKGINLLTSSIAAIGGLPPDDLGLNTTNPASAEARRAADTTLVQRAEEKQTTWGDRKVRAMTMAVAVRDAKSFAEVRREMSSLETIWREAQVPAIAQTMDAAVKGVEVGIFDIEQGQEQVGLSPNQRAAIKARAEEAAARSATADVQARLAFAEQIAGQPIAVSPNAALALAGLTIAASTNSADGAPQTPAA